MQAEIKLGNMFLENVLSSEASHENDFRFCKDTSEGNVNAMKRLEMQPIVIVSMLAC